MPPIRVEIALLRIVGPMWFHMGSLLRLIDIHLLLARFSKLLVINKMTLNQNTN